MLRVRNVQKRFGQAFALKDVSFEIRDGEVLGLIGPNGAGKSTLLECMAGQLPMDGGAVLNGDGRPVIAADTLFYVPDGITPWAAQRVSWLLDFFIGYFAGRAELRDSVVEQLELSSFLRQSLGTLSKGQRKRVLVAMGLLAPQPVLMIDEPLDGLDLKQMQELARVLRAHASLGRTLFLSIHQISDAARFCDRFVLLSGGRVCGEGTVKELAEIASARDGARTFATLEEVFLAIA
ncbi:MAG: ABC transporter ATP-binding protein [Acidobacteria bacterium]|nr:ABC transporter ATP-binding protein [Acidobacteriota bacterium]